MRRTKRDAATEPWEIPPGLDPDEIARIRRLERKLAKRIRSPVTTEALRSALRQAYGNITWAAALLGLSRVYTAELVRARDLADYARMIRTADGARAMGRPPVLGLLPEYRAHKLKQPPKW